MSAQLTPPGRERVEVIERPVDANAAIRAVDDRSMSLIHRGEVDEPTLLSARAPDAVGGPPAETMEVWRAEETTTMSVSDFGPMPSLSSSAPVSGASFGTIALPSGVSNVVGGLDVRDAISFDVAELAVQSILAVDTIPPDTSADGAVFANQDVTAPLAVTVTPVTDAPRLEVAPATGAEDSAIALDLAADLIRPAPGETLTLTVSGLPEGAALSAGTST
ncbi:hypothetical protein JMK10_20285, partial [Rhodovulum sulfidophilum]